MVLGTGIMKHIRKLLLFFYIKCLPLIYFIAILVTMRLISTLRSVTVKLQHQSLDIISAYEHKLVMFKINLSCLELILIRNFILSLRGS